MIECFRLTPESYICGSLIDLRGKTASCNFGKSRFQVGRRFNK
jgi:hypothetical protein